MNIEPMGTRTCFLSRITEGRKSGQDARVQRRVPRAGRVAARSSRRIKRVKACRFLIELEGGADDVGVARGRKSGREIESKKNPRRGAGVFDGNDLNRTLA